jgi:hypothetical protein
MFLSACMSSFGVGTPTKHYATHSAAKIKGRNSEIDFHMA